MTDPRRIIAAVLALTLTAVAGGAAAQVRRRSCSTWGQFDSFNEAGGDGAER